MRHGVVSDYDPKAGDSIATLAWEYPPRYDVPEHGHGSDQLIYATRGVMEVSAGQSFWLIPPHFSIWIPARTLHRIRMPGAVSMRTLYLKTGLARGLPEECAVLYVTPLLRELIVTAVRAGTLKANDRLHRALRDLIVAELKSASPVPTSVRLPRDRRALLVAEALIAELAGCALLEQALPDGRGQRPDRGTNFPGGDRYGFRGLAQTSALDERHRTAGGRQYGERSRFRGGIPPAERICSDVPGDAGIYAEGLDGRAHSW